MVFDDMPEDMRTKMSELAPDGDVVGAMVKALSNFHVGDENAIFQLILSLTTVFFTNDPVHTLIKGKKGRGKTNLVKSTLQLIPPEYVFYYDSANPRVILKDSDKFRDDFNIVVFDDVDLSQSRNVHFLKILTDYTAPARDFSRVKSGKPVHIHLKGNFLFIVITSKEDVSPDLDRRLYTIDLDKSINEYSKVD